MALRVGIDTGGTFVDVIVSDDRGGLLVSKSPSDPRDLAGSVISALEQAATECGLTLQEMLAQTERIVHGTTVATNVLLTRTGASAAMLTTRGFRDVLSMRRGARERPLDSRAHPPTPLIPRELIYEIDERIDCEGLELSPLDAGSVAAAVDALRGADIDGVAICFMFSFLDPGHEAAVGRQLAEHLPNVHVSASNEVLPKVGFYERMSTTALNAVVSPLLSRYLDALTARLDVDGFRGILLLMQSNGGVCAPDFGKRFGVRAVLSGPAAGPVAAVHVSSLYEIKNAISVDMGGTSFDVCLINDGRPEVTAEGALAGYRIAVPMVAIHTIGAGGGSVVGVDSRNLISVGPQSAAAYPGPACYGRGGTRPTVTDANLLLGYIDPAGFWGGRLTLDTKAAERAFSEHVGAPLGLSAIEAAFGAYRVVNESMVDAIREVSIRQGHDARRFMLIAAGGAGPLHVGALAAELDIPLVIVPRHASVFCALGGLLADLRHEFVTSLVTDLESLDRHRADRVLEDLTAQGRTVLAAEGVAESDIDLRAFVDLRYVGQFTELGVALTGSGFTNDSLDAARRAFHARHETVNGWHDPSSPLEIVNIGVVAVGRMRRPPMPRLARRAANGPRTAVQRRIHWNGSTEAVPVYRASELDPGSVVNGPALIDQENTTVIVPPVFDLLTDDYGNGLMYRQGASVHDILADLGGALPSVP